jgi:hypothetical protein
VAILAVLCFGAPLATVVYGGNLARESSYVIASWLAAAAAVGGALPVLALLTGLFLGMASWMADHAGQHVYALSLPVARWHYVLLRFGAGAMLLLVPVAAMGAGALLATTAVDLPAGIHAFPMVLTGRFALAALVCYALIFALSAATRQVALALLGALGGFFAADVLLGAFGQQPVVLPTMFKLLTTWPGPLAILMGRWALFDV